VTERKRRVTPAERREKRAAIEDAEVVMESAAAFLAVRPRSVEETRRRLHHLGYRHGLVDEVIERLLRMRYLDDDAFARAWVESRDRARPRGENALRRELFLKGVDRESVDTILLDRAADANETGPDAAAAIRLLERRRSALEREPDNRRRRQKAYALLARNGFDPTTCREAASLVDRWTDEPAIDDQEVNDA
jgi:regulatory protein